MKKNLLFTTCVMLCTIMGHAQNPGDLDTDFGISGYVITDHIANTGERYNDMITLANDQIILAGYTTAANENILISKHQPDGTLDDTFGDNGYVELDASQGDDEQAWAIAELNDGKLLITGRMSTSFKTSDGFVMRLNSDGSVDQSFGTTEPGRTNFNAGDNTFASGREIHLVGSNILIGGSAVFSAQTDMCVFKFTQGGGLDNSFASSGVASLDIDGENDNVNAMAIMSNGQILLGGTSEMGEPTFPTPFQKMRI